MTYLAGAGGIFHSVDLARLKSYAFEIGPLRPPSEGGSFSLLLRVTRNCPWNGCTFCYGRFYNREPFGLRSVDEVKADIDSAKAISDELIEFSLRLGYAGKVGPLAAVLQSQQLYGKEETDLTEKEFKNLYCLVTVFNFVVTGGENAFLQDADTPIMDTGQLVEVIEYLKRKYPGVKRIASFARSKPSSRKRQRSLAGSARLASPGFTSGWKRVTTSC